MLPTAKDTLSLKSDSLSHLKDIEADDIEGGCCSRCPARPPRFSSRIAKAPEQIRL